MAANTQSPANPPTPVNPATAGNLPAVCSFPRNYKNAPRGFSLTLPGGQQNGLSRIMFDTKPLPPVSVVQDAVSGKNINVTGVFNPKITDPDGQVDLTQPQAFNPKLTITIAYDPSDIPLDTTGNPKRKKDGTLALWIVSYWPSGANWQGQLLDTIIDETNRMLTANLDTLPAGDPVGIGS